MSRPVQVAVVGGGITGLCAGYYLARALGPEQVMVLEAGETPGGTAQTEIAGGYVCEWGPNGFLDKEPKTLQWAAELGLGERLLRADASAARRFVFKGDKLHEIKPPPAFLKSPLLSLRGRARLLCEPLIPAKRDETPESIWDFAARRIGREAADTLVTPMVSGVFGGDAKQLSLAHCFPSMAAMEREHGGLFRALRARRKAEPGASPMGPKGTLTCFAEGMGLLTETAAAQLGPCLRLGARVTALGRARVPARRFEDTPEARAEDRPLTPPLSRREREPEGFALTLATGETITTEQVIIACPAYAAADFLAPLDAALAETLASIPYASIAVLCTGHARSQVAHDLHGFGFLVPRTEGLRALGCLWSSSIFPAHAPQGKVLLRTMYGGATDPGAVALTDAQLLALFQEEVGRTLGVSGEPDLVRIYRWERGIPQYDLEHGARLEAIEAAERRHPGLHFAGNAYRGVGLNDCVVSAHRALARVLGE